MRDCILVQNYGGIRWECNFVFGESRYSPIEAFLTLKKKKRMIVHRIIWNNQFAVEIEKLLALVGQIERKNKGSLGDNHRLKKKWIIRWQQYWKWGSLSTLNSPTYAALPKWECSAGPYLNPNPAPQPNTNSVWLANLFWIRLENSKIALRFREPSDYREIPTGFSVIHRLVWIFN